MSAIGPFEESMTRDEQSPPCHCSSCADLDYMPARRGYLG